MLRGVAIALLPFVLCGCVFSRTVVNGHVREIDTSWIRPGETTQAEVIARLGRPPALTGVKGLRAGRSGAVSALLGDSGVGGTPAVGMDAEGEFGGRASRAFRWYASDTRVNSFEGGMYFVPTFSGRRQGRAYDIYILFDEQGVVTLVSRTEIRDGEIRVLEWREAPE